MRAEKKRLIAEWKFTKAEQEERLMRQTDRERQELLLKESQKREQQLKQLKAKQQRAISSMRKQLVSAQRSGDKQLLSGLVRVAQGAGTSTNAPRST